MSILTDKGINTERSSLMRFAGELYNGISAVANTAGKAVSAAKRALQFGEYAGDPQVLQYFYFQPKEFHYPPSPTSVALGMPFAGWVKPAPSFTKIARAQGGILDPITDKEQIDESHQANYETSTEATLQALYKLQDGKLVLKGH